MITDTVALFTGAWIEICATSIMQTLPTMSRSLRARGLKSSNMVDSVVTDPVALFTGAWIEIEIPRPSAYHNAVALFTGAWIEIIAL